MFTDSTGRLQPAWAFIVSALMCCAAFVLCGYFAAAIAGDHVLRFEAIFRPSLAAVLLAGLSWLLTVGNHVESHQLAAQGLPLTQGWSRQFAIGAGLAFVLVLLAVGVLGMLGHLSFRVILSSHSLQRTLVVLFVFATGSLAEELMFRGYPFQRLAEAIGAGGAILVFSTLFGLVHVLNPGASAWGLLNTVVIGVALSVAYLRTRALWMPWGFHFAWNTTLGLIAGLPVSGIRMFNTVVHATAQGPKWLTGQSYGLEASLPAAAAVVVSLLFFWRAPLPFLGNTQAQDSSATETDRAASDVNTSSHPPVDLGI